MANITKSKIETCTEIYKTACALNGSYPIPDIEKFLDSGIIDIKADKLSYSDWQPACQLLRSAHDLKFVAVRSFTDNDSSHPDIKEKQRSIQRMGFITELIASISLAMVSNRNTLTCLELQNIPLSNQDIHLLMQGLLKNKSITHLSLQECLIGDLAFKVLSKAIKNVLNITSINLSACALSWKGIETIGNILKNQTVSRQSKAWKGTLREKPTDLDKMDGLQRITLNNNLKIGDKGAKLLSEIIKEDAWLKALDLQSCNITDGGVRAVLDSLKQNSTLYILDVRKNPIRDRDLIVRIGQHLSFNAQGNTAQFKWLEYSLKSKETLTKSGIPWRVSTRLSSLRHLPTHVPGIANVFLLSNPHLFDYVEEEIVSKHHKGSPKVPVDDEQFLQDIANQLEELKLLTEKERELREAAEKKIEELSIENRMLKEKLTKEHSSSVLTNDTLEAIEVTFTKFNEFLNLLRTSRSKVSDVRSPPEAPT